MNYKGGNESLVKSVCLLFDASYLVRFLLEVAPLSESRMRKKELGSDAITLSHLRHE